MDEPTTNISRTSYARICIEVGIEKPLPESVQVEFEEDFEFWLFPVEFEWKPPSCSLCISFGHNQKNCSKKTHGKIEEAGLDSQNQAIWDRLLVSNHLPLKLNETILLQNTTKNVFNNLWIEDVATSGFTED